MPAHIAELQRTAHLAAARPPAAAHASLGAVCGLLAAVGLLVMAATYVRHAHAVRRLRRWAGRRPEDDAQARQQITARAHCRGLEPERAALRHARLRRARLRAEALVPRLASALLGLLLIGLVAAFWPGSPLWHDSTRPDADWLQSTDPRPGQVRVINAAGVPGLALQVAHRLTRAGLHIVAIDTAPVASTSQITAGRDDRTAGQLAARILHLALHRTPTNDPVRGADIVVRLGLNAYR